MGSPFQPAIDELEKELDAIERQFAEIERSKNGLLSTINVLRSKAGLPPRPDNSGGGSGSATPPGGGGGGLPVIRHDTFFGKKMGTAAREYLELRFEAHGGTNPAKPREIFDALKDGGFVFETKHDTVAIISLRNMLRKASQTFLKLPNGTYGLRSWYPGAKKAKAQVEDEEEEVSETETASAKKVATTS